jgi:hypothetical protein
MSEIGITCKLCGDVELYPYAFKIEIHAHMVRARFTCRYCDITQYRRLSSRDVQALKDLGVREERFTEIISEDEIDAFAIQLDDPRSQEHIWKELIGRWSS